MYNATAHLSSLITWDRDWIHFGTENEIKLGLLEKLIEEHLSGNDLLFIHGRTTSRQIKKEEIIKTIRPFLGTDDFQLWTVTMDKVIRFNKIGVLHLGQRIKKDLEKSTDTAVFTTKFVLEDNKVVTYVTHEIEQHYLFPILFIATGKQVKEYQKRKSIAYVIFGVILLGIAINLVSHVITNGT